MWRSSQPSAGGLPSLPCRVAGRPAVPLSLAAMLAHAGGAAAIDAPVWLLAYGAAALVLLVTVTLRGRILVASGRTGRDDRTDVDGRADTAGEYVAWRVAGTLVGHVVGVGLLAAAVAAALFGPAASAANVAPGAVLTVWWIGLPMACIAVGDVMTWLDPFGTLARIPEHRGDRRSVTGRTDTERRAPSWTAAGLMAVWAWWILAYHDGRTPRSLGWFLVSYTAVAVGGAIVWGRRWLREGEAFGAVSSALAWARRSRRPGIAVDAVAALVAVWLGAVAFDLFSGTRAWVDLAGGSSGWERTASATACLAVAIALAALTVGGTARLAATREAAVYGWLATTAGLFVGHGIPVLLLDGQFALALASDPFGQGWDLFGTADRTIDYSPLSPGLVGVLQCAATAGGAAWGVAVAARSLRSQADTDRSAAVRTLWIVGAILAVAAAAGVAVLAAELE